MKHKRTKKLSASEYNGLPFDFQAVLKEHLNKEEKLWYSTVPPGYYEELGNNYMKYRKRKKLKSFFKRLLDYKMCMSYEKNI